jgi:hypothetical protein
MLTIRRATLTPWPLQAGVALHVEDLETVEPESDSTPGSGVCTKN